MFYKNLKTQKKPSKHRLVFSIFDEHIDTRKDETLEKANSCHRCYNLCCNDGTLKTGLGFRDFRIPQSETDLESEWHVYNFEDYVDEIIDIYLERWYDSRNKRTYYQFLLMDNTFSVYGAPLENEYDDLVVYRTDRLKHAPVSVAPYRIKNADVTLFFSVDGVVVIGEFYDAIYPKVLPMVSAVVHYDRFFGIKEEDQSQLVYTDNLDLTTWSGEEVNTVIEFVDNRGKFKKLVNFKDYVYLFREFGITRISIYSTKSEFSFTHLYDSTSMIFENTICVCGSEIWFFTRDGLYAFNGSSVQKICGFYDDYFKKINHANSSVATSNGKFYIATRCEFDDGEKVGCEVKTFVNNVLFEIDINTHDLNILRGVDIRKILKIDCPYFSKLLACFNDNKTKVGELFNLGENFGKSLPKLWESNSTDLGYIGKRKKIVEVLLVSKFDCVIEIVSDEESKSYDVKGSDKQQKVGVCVYGTNFRFRFKTNLKDCEIHRPVATFEVV